MPRRKINRTLEEEEKFKKQRLERNMENQRHRRQAAKHHLLTLFYQKQLIKQFTVFLVRYIMIA